jgi:hypothetical protein
MKRQKAPTRWTAAGVAAMMLAMVPAGNVSAAPTPTNVPELMKTFSGQNISSREAWEKTRAPEILERYTRDVFGIRPREAGERARFSFTVTDERDAFDGKAVRKHVRLDVRGLKGTYALPITVFIPKAAKPAPAFIYAGIYHSTEVDRAGHITKSRYWPVKDIIDRGYATASFMVTNVAADAKSCFTGGIFTAMGGTGKRDADAWGAISAWAWAASRVLDWMETEPLIDATHVGIVGHSRGGKTAIWTAVTDKRFAMACSNNSGCSGAKLNHIDLPRSEHIGQILKHFSYWFCPNYRSYIGKEMSMPFDQHELLALIAPRLLYVTSATRDSWAGPHGEWWAARLASPAWELYGKKGLAADTFPQPNRPSQEGSVAYHLRAGGHDLTPYDWMRFVDFAERHGWRK